MVVLSPNFTVLASLSVLAVVSMIPTSVEAVALPSPPHRAGSRGSPPSRQSSNQGSSVDGGSSHSPDVKGADADPFGAAAIPTLPLPGLRKKRSSPLENRLEQRWDPLNPVLELGSLWLGTGQPPQKRDGPDVEVSGSDDHVHVSHHADAQGKVLVTGDGEHVHIHRRAPSPDPHHHHHHHGSHDDVVVSGDDDHVNLHMKRSPRSHHHHKVVVSGDHDHVNVHQKRAPRRHHHHHGHHRRASHDHHHHKVVVSGDHDHVNVHSRQDSGLSIPLLSKDRSILVPSIARRAPEPGLLGEAVVTNGDHMVLDVKKRQFTAFAEPEGVPGTVDIMSAVDGSPAGQRIASLTLSSAMEEDVKGNPDPFVLNASNNNQTQIYMVVLPDDDEDPSEPTPSTDPSSSNSTSPAYSSPAGPSSPEGSTTPSDATSPNDPQSISPASVSAASSASNSTVPGNSTSSTNSTDAAEYKRVALKIPLFDAESATMQAYCATFDPQPEAPSPLTVESCSDGPVNDEHKSQIFAFYPSTGVIQPMWFEGQDDGMSDDDDADEGNVDDGGDAALDPPSSGNSTAPAPVTSTSDVDSTMSRIESLSDKLLDTGSTIRQPTPDISATAHTFAAESIASAQNVTLMFTPATPELGAQSAPEDRLVSSSSASVPSATTTTSTAIATETDVNSNDVSTTVGFSSAAPTTTASDDATSSSSSATVTFSPAAASSTPSFSSSSSGPASSLSPSPSSNASSTSTTLANANAVTTASSPSSSAASSTSAHTLGVQVFDPEATSSAIDSSAMATGTSTADITSSSAATDSSSSASPSSTSLGAQGLATSSTSSSASVNATVTPAASSTASPSATMTPVSTSPYEWMFKETKRAVKKDSGFA